MDGRVWYSCTPTRSSFFLRFCTNAGMASRAAELREGFFLMVLAAPMSYSSH